MKQGTGSIKDLFESNNIGTFGSAAGWNITIGHVPDLPDKTIMLFNEQGREPVYTESKSTENHLEYQDVRIWVRARKYTTCRDKMDTIVNLLDGQSAYTETEDSQKTRVGGWNRRSNPYELTTADEKGRTIFAVVVWCVKQDK